MGVGIIRDYTIKRRDLNTSDTLGSVGRHNSKPSIGSHGHSGDKSPVQTWKTPKDLSGCGEGVGHPRCKGIRNARGCVCSSGSRSCKKAGLWGIEIEYLG